MNFQLKSVISFGLKPIQKRKNGSSLLFFTLLGLRTEEGGNVFVSSSTGHSNLRLIFEIFVWSGAKNSGLDNYNLKGQM